LVQLTLRANAHAQGGAECGTRIWGKRNPTIGLGFAFVIFFLIFSGLIGNPVTVSFALRSL
jgi:hypothetical protein